MIRHIFLGAARPEATAEDIDQLVLEWRGLAQKIPAVTSLAAGRNVSPREQFQRYSVALVAEFDNLDSWAQYMDHPAHLEVRQRLSSKVIDPNTIAVVQIEV
jgi:hypothetical protein